MGPDVLAAVERARDAALERRFDEARVLALGILEQHPHCLPAWRTLAWSQLEAGDDEALGSLETCLELDPEDAVAEVGCAIWYEGRGDRGRAVERLTRAWELQPSHQGVRRALAGRVQELPESRLAQGVAMVNRARYEDAVELLGDATAENPPDVAALLTLMAALWHLGARQRVAHLANAVLGVRPHCVTALLYLAAVEEREGHTLRMRELLARAEHVDPGLLLSHPTLRETGLRTVLERTPTPHQPLAASR